MIAIDTNLVIRYLTDDHPRQSPRARALIDASEVWLATTVLVETEWVLRSAYGHSGGEVAAALRGFAGLPTVRTQDAAVAAQALEWAGKGMDFADALHLAAAAGCEAFVSFDEGLAKAARALSGVNVRKP